VGLLLLPLALVFLGVVLAGLTWGVGALLRLTRGAPRRWQRCSMAVAQAVALAALAVALAYLTQRGARVYAFELLLYVTFMPLLGMTALGAALLRWAPERRRGIGAALLIGTVFIGPLVFTWGEAAAGWLRIETYY
jgi:hypothetical protein